MAKLGLALFFFALVFSQVENHCAQRPQFLPTPAPMSFALGGRPSLGGRSLAKAIAPKEVYSFPVLEPEEIADVLREMGAAVTEEDLNKPKPDTFRQWCELFVIEVLGMNKEELYQTHFEFVEALDGTEELHEASVPILHFVRNM